ncbi:hypothetical protein [Clostridium paraputrificum]|uniref:hypothetical protein n=1 Tax=Clostridium paraputrificum TaxID=29363 RepID=UPI002FCD7D71
MKIRSIISNFFCRYRIQKNIYDEITDRYEIIEDMKYYYVTHFNISELKIKLIELEEIYNNIKKPKDKAMIISMMSIAITVAFNLFNSLEVNLNQEKILFENEITRYEDLKNTYWMKVLEVENEIKFTKDIEKKAQLEDYTKSLKQEINIINNNLVNKLENNINNNNFNVPIVLLKTLAVYIFIQFILIVIEEFIWLFRKRKKDELKIRIDVIKSLIN